MAANLSAVMDDTDKVHAVLEDASPTGSSSCRPTSIASDYRFVPVDSKTIRYGLGAIKGTGEAAIAAIVAARTRTGPLAICSISAAASTSASSTGASSRRWCAPAPLIAIDAHRAGLLASVGIALESAEQAGRAANQVSLFGEVRYAGEPTGPD